MSNFMVNRSTIKALLNGGEILLGRCEDITLKGDFTMEQLMRENPIPMVLFCPLCHMRHVDKGKFATEPHHTHACQNCGMVWRPAIEPTVGVVFLPGFKDSPT